MMLTVERAELAPAAVELTPKINHIDDFGPSLLVGLKDATGVQAVAVIHRSTGFDALLSLACRDARWGYNLRTLGKTIGTICFDVLKLKRLTAKCAKRNKAARCLLEASGFRLEGNMPLAWDGRQSALLYGCKQKHFRW